MGTFYQSARSPTQKNRQPFFEQFAFAQRHLPFMVVGAVTGAASWLLLAADVHSQILHLIVIVMTVAMVDALRRSESAAKVLRHYPTVLKNISAFKSHLDKHRQVIIRNRVLSKFYIAVVFIYGAARRISFCAKRGCADFLAPAGAAKTGKIRSRHPQSKFIPTIPTLRIALRTNHFSAGLKFSAYPHVNRWVTDDYSRMLWQRV